MEAKTAKEAKTGDTTEIGLHTNAGPTAVAVTAEEDNSTEDMAAEAVMAVAAITVAAITAEAASETISNPKTETISIKAIQALSPLQPPHQVVALTLFLLLQLKTQMSRVKETEEG